MKIKCKISFMDLLANLVLIELVLGGSGHFIQVGGIGIRLVLMAIMVFSIFFIKIRLDKNNKLLLIFMGYLTFLLIGSVVINDIEKAVDEYLGYLPLLTVFFFQQYFRFRKERIGQIVQLFCNLTVVLAVWSLIIWGYSFINGVRVYPEVSGWLNHYDYGMISYMGNIPRLFLKGSVFINIGMFFELDKLLSYKRNFMQFVKVIVLGLSIISTFTVGFWAFAGLIVVGIVIHRINKNYKNVVLIGFCLSLLLVIFIKFDILSIIMSRFTGDYDFSYKSNQSVALLLDTLTSPLFGNGLGHEVAFFTGIKMVEQYHFEVMWLQLLNHTGTIGFLLMNSMIFLTVRKLFMKYKKTRIANFYLLAVGILFVYLESFTNPFFNNAIGLLFFVIGNAVAFTEDTLEIKKTDKERR